MSTKDEARTGSMTVANRATTQILGKVRTNRIGNTAPAPQSRCAINKPDECGASMATWRLCIGGGTARCMAHACADIGGG